MKKFRMEGCSDRSEIRSQNHIPVELESDMFVATVVVAVVVAVVVIVVAAVDRRFHSHSSHLMIHFQSKNWYGQMLVDSQIHLQCH